VDRRRAREAADAGTVLFSTALAYSPLRFEDLIMRRFCLALSSPLFALVACLSPASPEDSADPAPSASEFTATSSATDSTATTERVDSEYRHNRCGPGIAACPAAEAGQPCNPDNLSFLCSPQSNGSFCCLPVLQ
jgi:hypothetical protein